MKCKTKIAKMPDYEYAFEVKGDRVTVTVPMTRKQMLAIVDNAAKADMMSIAGWVKFRLCD